MATFLALVFGLSWFNSTLVEGDYDLSAAPVGFSGLQPNMKLIPGDIDGGGIGGKGIEAAHSGSLICSSKSLAILLISEARALT